MSKLFKVASATFFLAATVASPIKAQTPLSSTVGGGDMIVRKAGRPRGGGEIITPDSSVARPSQAGIRAHTHFKIFIPTQPADLPSSPAAMSPYAHLPPYSGYLFETPASLACIYGLVAARSGCNPNVVSTVAKGGARAIAVVDAYHYATAASDLQIFSSQFGLPQANLHVVYASGAQPTTNEGWATEAALDIEMAHAMAPNATIYLVEATSNNNADLDQAVDTASQLVASAGGGEVSMSFGSAEYASQVQDDAHFAGRSNVVFFASTGDSPGAEYPSTSPNVVAVGGTSTSRDADSGVLLQETAWSDGGGGLSAYFNRPGYQHRIASNIGDADQRAVPDVAAVANPTTGVWIYCGASCGTGGWMIVGGTSVASPLMAGLTNAAGAFRPSTRAELAFIYSKFDSPSFFDVALGVCGPYAGYFASQAGPSARAQSYDLCTGIGAPRGLSGL